MPARSGTELGPEPPEAPRKIPALYKKRMRWSLNVGLWLGAIFTLFGGGFLAILLLVAKTKEAYWISIFPGLFFVGGLSILVKSWTHASHILHAFRHGEAAKGQVTEIILDTTQHINNRHPLRISYEFEDNASSQVHRGYVETWDRGMIKFREGSPIWIVYNPKDPSKSATYPPIS